MTHFSKYSFSLCLLSLALAALPLSTQAAGRNGGAVSVGYLTKNDIETNFFFGDFTLRLAQEAWGAELGMFGVVGRLHESYVTATYSARAGKLSFGFPRPAYDDFGTSALTTMMPRLSLDSVGSIRSRTTYGTMYLPDFLPYGARFSAQTGVLDYAVSLHSVPKYSDVIAGGALRWSQGPWAIDLATEAVMQDTKTQWNSKAQVVRDLGITTLGLGIFDPKANNQAPLVEAFGRFDVWDNAEITGLVRASTESGPTFGLGLSHQVTSQWTLQAGIFGPKTGDFSTSASLRVLF